MGHNDDKKQSTSFDKQVVEKLIKDLDIHITKAENTAKIIDTKGYDANSLVGRKQMAEYIRGDVQFKTEVGKLLTQLLTGDSSYIPPKTFTSSPEAFSKGKTGDEINEGGHKTTLM